MIVSKYFLSPCNNFFVVLPLILGVLWSSDTSTDVKIRTFQHFPFHHIPLVKVFIEYKYLSGKSFLGQNFLSGKIFFTQPKFCHFCSRRNFPWYVMQITEEKYNYN